MNFASLEFAWFLPLVLGLYWILRRTEYQNWLLLAVSYYFYGSWDPRFLLLIWFLTGASYYAGLLLAGSQDNWFRRRVLQVYVLISLGVLSVFKYFNFFVGSAREVLLGLGFEAEPWTLDIVLPAAISFFTFESLSYVIEIYQRHLPGTTKLRHYALFIAFFPKLVAGPIERPAVLIPQIESSRALNSDLIGRGVFLILLGLVKKVAIADGLAPAVDSIYGAPVPQAPSDIAMATAFFAIQIYCDFSGYTDIARGAAKLMGIELSQNFRFPYFSQGPSEFWRRWHISLSSWLRDYLYIPRGGNRGGEGRVRLNLMLTMLLGGLWHGAAWNYVLWGAYQGGLLVIYRIWGIEVQPRKGWAWRALRTMLFFVLTCYGWLLFRATSLDQVLDYSRALLTGHYSLQLHVAWPPLATWLGVALLVAHDYFAYQSQSATFYRRWPVLLAGLSAALMVFSVLMGLSSARSSFIYFQF